MPRVPAPAFVRLSLLLVVSGLAALWALPVRAEGVPAAGVPVAQVFRVEGTATVRVVGAARAVPLLRGAVLHAEDRIEVKRGAEVGLYYRQGGRQLLRAGSRSLSGTVAALAPSLTPYRGSSVSFGATRDGETGIVAGAATTESRPMETLILSSAPQVTVTWRGEASDAAGAERIVLRVLFRDSVVAAASVVEPAPGASLSLVVPALRSGDDYRFEVMVFPDNVGAAPCLHAIPVYILAPSRRGAAADQFLTDFFYRRDMLAVLSDRGGARMILDQELSLSEPGPPSLAISITPSRPAGPR